MTGAHECHVRATVLVAALCVFPGASCTLAEPQPSNGNGDGVADPSLLPRAAAGQAPNLAAYNALNVPGRPAGFSYSDPLTGVLVFKIGDPSTPVSGTANQGQVPSYAEGGPHISLPWRDDNDHAMYTLHLLVNSTGYFVDFDYTARAFKRWRVAPVGELRGGFSTNPATPLIYYRVSADAGFERYDTGSDQVANTGNFPSGNLLGAGVNFWFIKDNHDEWFVAHNPSTQAVVAWNARTDETVDCGTASDEPKMTRDGVVTVFNFHSSTNQAQCDLSTGQITSIQAAWITDFAVTHPAGVGRYWVGADPTLAGGPREFYYDPVTHTRTFLGEPLEVCIAHRAGQWVVDNGTGLQQWLLGSGYDCTSEKLADGLGFYRLADAGLDDVRLLAHHYSASASVQYYAQPHATISPDGRVVLWGSDMNVAGGRIDAFLAIVPTR